MHRLAVVLQPLPAIVAAAEEARRPDGRRDRLGNGRDPPAARLRRGAASARSTANRAGHGREPRDRLARRDHEAVQGPAAGPPDPPAPRGRRLRPRARCPSSTPSSASSRAWRTASPTARRPSTGASSASNPRTATLRKHYPRGRRPLHQRRRRGPEAPRGVPRRRARQGPLRRRKTRSARRCWSTTSPFTVIGVHAEEDADGRSTAAPTRTTPSSRSTTFKAHVRTRPRRTSSSSASRTTRADGRPRSADLNEVLGGEVRLRPRGHARAAILGHGRETRRSASNILSASRSSSASSAR